MKATCENCQARLNHPHRPLQHVLLAVTIILATLSLAGVRVLRDTVVDLRATVSKSSNLPNNTQPSPPPSSASKRCDFPFVYNKPHKTASTKIQNDIVSWARNVGRNAYNCTGFINQAIMQMRECIPRDNSGCAIIATHVVLSPVMTAILQQKIGKFFIVTSTRNPRNRILSHYFQIRGTNASHVLSNSADLLQFMRNQNPWMLYNYHTGDNRHGSCPLTENEQLLIPDMVNRADFVIDIDLFNVSQTILKANRLFPLTGFTTNVRHSNEFVGNEQIEQAIKNVTCVEEEIHRLYRLRMASLYEKATGKKCLSYSRHPTTTCFDG